MIRLARLTTAFAVTALLIPTVTSTAAAQDAPLLFEIEGEKPSYIFGMFHRAFKETSELPAVVAEKLGGVDMILEENKQPDREKLQKYLMIPEGKTLKDVLPEDLYKEVEARLQSKGFPIQRMATYQPWVMAMQLVEFEFMQEMQQGIGQPASLAKVIGNKPKEGLTDFEESAGAFAGAEMPDQVQILRDVLGKLKEWDEAGVKPNTDWMKAYVSGDADKIYEVWKQDMTGESDALNETLINAGYGEQIERLAKRIAEKVKAGDKSYGVVVGCHLLGGPESLVKALEAEGLKIKRVGG